MPFIPASLAVHLALTSLVSVAWAFLTMRLLRIRYPAARALILGVSVLLPAGGFLIHLAYPRYCTGLLSALNHFACLASSALGRVGTLLFLSSLVVAASQAAASWRAQRVAMRAAVPLEAMVWDDECLGAAVKRAAARAIGASRRPPRIFVTGRPGICCTVGVLRPAILISLEFCRAMDEGEIEAALAHEVAHIRRGDNGVGLASVVFRALTFFSPAAYIAVRQYMDEREKAADDLAVAATGDRLALASAIIKVARSTPRAAGANAAGASASGTVSRVRRLMDSGSDSVGDKDLRGGRLICVLASVAGIVAITLYLC